MVLAGFEHSSMDPAASVRFNRIRPSQYKSVVKLNIGRILRERRIVTSALNNVPATRRPPIAPPPSIPGAWPLLGHIQLLNLESMSKTLSKVHGEQGSRVLELNLAGQKVFHLRHPDDIITVMKTNADVFRKPPGIRRLNKWLGEGLPAQTDDTAHARQRALLNPAFRADYLRNLIPSFARQGSHMADLLASSNRAPVDVQELSRRVALDIIGIAGFNYNFGALSHSALVSWSCICHLLLLSGQSSGSFICQLIRPEVHAAICCHILWCTLSTLLEGLRRLKSLYLECKERGDTQDPLAMFDGLNEAAMKLAFNLPLPDFLIPGYRRYCKSISELESAVAAVIQERRLKGLQDTDVDMLAFMMRSQQQSGLREPTEKLMRDEIMTLLFAGSDTTSHTLGFMLHSLAMHPSYQNRLLEEGKKVLGGRDAADWRYTDLQQMPFALACVNETLRLYNTAVGAPRIAAQDTMLGNYAVPAGTVCISDIYCLHRNEELWPSPDEWRPERFLEEGRESLGPRHPNAFLPFLAGNRSCIGRQFALLELQTLVAAVVRKVNLSSAETLDIIQDMTLRARGGIWLQAAERSL